MKKKAVIVDLDGTLITGNSLHEYLRAGAIVALSRGNFRKFVSLLGVVMKRLLRRSSHYDFKLALYDLIGEDETVLKCLDKLLRQMLNRKVVRRIEKLKAEGYIVVVATAAFDFYASRLTDYITIATTDIYRKGECRGEEKMNLVKKKLDALGAEPAVVISDHSDDMPLMRMATERCILVNPSVKTLMTLKSETFPHPPELL